MLHSPTHDLLLADAGKRAALSAALNDRYWTRIKGFLLKSAREPTVTCMGRPDNITPSKKNPGGDPGS
jgi:hypothetical protein